MFQYIEQPSKAVSLKFNYPVLAKPEICQHCKTCMAACPVKAIKDIDPRFEVDISKCAARSDCFSCVMHCKSHALVLKQADTKEKINILTR